MSRRSAAPVAVATLLLLITPTLGSRATEPLANLGGGFQGCLFSMKTPGKQVVFPALGVADLKRGPAPSNGLFGVCGHWGIRVNGDDDSPIRLVSGRKTVKWEGQARVFNSAGDDFWDVRRRKGKENDRGFAHLEFRPPSGYGSWNDFTMSQYNSGNPFVPISCGFRGLNKAIFPDEVGGCVCKFAQWDPLLELIIPDLQAQLEAELEAQMLTLARMEVAARDRKPPIK